MLRRPILSSVALLAAGPALADVDPSAVWADLQEALAGYGYEVGTGEVAEDAAGVSVRDLTLTQTSETETFDDTFQEVTQTSTVVLTLPTLSIADAGENADIAFPPEMPLTVTTVTGEETVVVRGTISQEAMTTTVSEVPDGLAYDYAAQAVRFVLDGVEGAGAPPSADGTVTISDLAGRSVATVAGGVRTVAQTQSSGPVEASMRVDQGGEEGTVDLRVTVAEATSQGELSMPEGTSLAGTGGADTAALPEGVAVAGRAEVGALSLAMTVEAPGEGFSYASDSAGLAFDIALGDGRMVYGLAGRGGEVRLSGDQIPLPQVAFSLGGSELRLDIPLQGDEAAQPFSLLTALRDLTIDEAVWSLFDAGQVLDRAPASLRIDLAGTVDVPEAAEEATPMPSFPQPRTLEIGGIDLSLLGAALRARGALTAAEGGLSVMGPPQVEGMIEIDLTGVQGLLRDLVSAGLLPPEQAAFAGGMLGFMARPTGEDSFASEIVFGPDGSITANGMPLQ